MINLKDEKKLVEGNVVTFKTLLDEDSISETTIEGEILGIDGDEISIQSWVAGDPQIFEVNVKDLIIEETNKTNEEKKERMLENNDYNWYVVEYDDGDIELKHSSSLSNILQCGQEMEDFGITSLEQCG